MLVGEIFQCRKTILLEYARNNDVKYGEQFEKFSTKISQTFDKIIKISFQGKMEKLEMSFVMLGAIIVMKNLRKLSGEQSSLRFIDQIMTNHKTLFKENPHININRFLDLMSSKIQTSVKIREVIPLDNLLHTIIDDLMHAITSTHSKDLLQKLSEQQINSIGTFFSESICLINYDQNKDCLRGIEINYKNIYLLKAKKMNFILIKEQQIQAIEYGSITHEEFASIFSIQNKLQDSPTKSNNSLSSKITANDHQTTKSRINSVIKPNVQSSSQLASSRLNYSVIFPQEVPCGICYKKISEFNAIFWNYSHYCFECILNPKMDVSFIPSSVIQKFLKNQKRNYRQYVVICPECRGDTIIGNYRPWDKPKNYKCKVCLKHICVQHQKMVNQCFCFCQKCNQPTLTIPNVFVKFCVNCRARVCEICNNKSRVQCECICEKCGKNKLIDHEQCMPRCHFCNAKEIQLLQCKCKKNLCSICFFNSLQNFNICQSDIK